MLKAHYLYLQYTLVIKNYCSLKLEQDRESAKFIK